MKGCISLMNSVKWKDFFTYYKWHLSFAVLVLICAIFIISSLTTSYEADIYIGYVGYNSGYMDVQKFNDNKSDIEKLLKDANNDGSRHAELYVFSANKKKEAAKLFSDMIDTESYHLYIAPKVIIEEYEDKNHFATLKKPVTSVECLTDSGGRVYAISLEKNSYIEMLGLRDTSGLYIAAANFNKDELTDYEKNSINIANFVIESRKNYN